MWRRIKQAGLVLYRAGDNLAENDGIEFAGYLTFLSLLALFPFLVLIVAIAGFVGRGDLGTQFIELMFSYLPHDAVEAIEPRVEEIISGPPQALLTISILGAIWTSSSAVEGIRTVLNRAYQVSNPPTYVFRRMMSILQLILFTFVIILVMSVLVVPPILLERFESWWGVTVLADVRSDWGQFLIYLGIGLLFCMIASIYYLLPNIKQNLLSVLPGALLVVVLWVAGASGFTFYISHVDQVSIIYGSLGGFIATMLFFFIMNIIFIYGAEFNFQIASAFGAKVEEREHVDDDAHAVHLSDH